MSHVYRVTSPAVTTLVKADTRAQALSFVARNMSVTRLGVDELLTSYDSGETIHSAIAVETADATDEAGA